MSGSPKIHTFVLNVLQRKVIDREPGGVILAKGVTNAEVYGNVVHGSQYKEIDLCRTPVGGLRCEGYKNDTPKLG